MRGQIRIFTCPHCKQEFTTKHGLKTHIEHPYCPVVRAQHSEQASLQAEEKPTSEPEPQKRRWVNNPRISMGNVTVWMRQDDE